MPFDVPTASIEPFGLKDKLRMSALRSNIVCERRTKSISKTCCACVLPTAAYLPPTETPTHVPRNPAGRSYTRCNLVARPNDHTRTELESTDAKYLLSKANDIPRERV